MEPGHAAGRRVHGEGAAGPPRAERHAEPRVVEPRAVRLRLARARVPEPAAVAGAAGQRPLRGREPRLGAEEDGRYRRYFDRGSAKVQHTFRF